MWCRPTDVSARELRHHLLEALPDYMAPSEFVILKALPITANGKVDRRALPEPERLGDAVGTNHVGPRNALEETLVALWAEVLQRERVGINDDFFECGGNSLLAMQLLSRVRAAFDDSASAAPRIRSAYRRSVRTHHRRAFGAR